MSSRYSIWLDSKLRLQSDPYLILEYFLWRKGHEYAISNHYDRHCVWDEVAQNKKLNKYNHTVIDQQFEFYQSDGLKRFDPSDPNKLLPSSMYRNSSEYLVNSVNNLFLLYSGIWFQFSFSKKCNVWMLIRCSGRFFDSKSTYADVKLVFMFMVQWGGSFYSSRSAKFCLHLHET